jgi:hypothetical protein
MRLWIRTHNLDAAIARYEHLAEAATDMQPAMEEVMLIMMGAIKATFLSGGRRGGGSWAALTTEWLLRKERMGWDPRIGFARHRLYEAFTIPGADHQRLRVGPHSVEIESDLPYAATQQAHRPFIKFTMRDRREMAQVCSEYLVAAWNRTP